MFVAGRFADVPGAIADLDRAINVLRKFEVDSRPEAFLLFKKGELLTPPVSDGALDGITRQVILELAREAGIPVVEKSLTRYDIFTADECFLTGSAAEVIPVASLDGRPIADGNPGEVTKRLLAAFHELTRSSGTPID